MAEDIIIPHLGPDELKSYLPENDRKDALTVGDMRFLYVAESAAAWGWLRLIPLGDVSLRSLKRSYGSDFIRKNGFDTTKADLALGSDWLDK